MLLLNKKRITKIILLAILLLTIFIKPSNAIVKPTSNFYVNDYADLLSSETKDYIMSMNISLNKQTGAQIVVVTVKNLEGNSLEDYATTLFRNFGIGDKTKNNGVLLLLALEERQFRIEVGYGLEGALPDGKTGRIQDEYIIPYLKNNEWDSGIKNGFNTVLEVVANEYGITIDDSKTAINYNKSNEDDNTDGDFALTGTNMLSGIVLGLITRFGKKIRKKAWIIIPIICILINIIICVGYGIGISDIFSYLFIFFMGLIIGLFSGMGGGRGSFSGGRWRFLRRPEVSREAGGSSGGGGSSRGF